MLKFYIPSVLFATGTSLVKFLFVILLGQFLHGDSICYMHITVAVSNEGDLSSHISQTIYFPERMKIRIQTENLCKKLPNVHQQNKEQTHCS